MRIQIDTYMSNVLFAGCFFKFVYAEIDSVEKDPNGTKYTVFQTKFEPGRIGVTSRGGWQCECVSCIRTFIILHSNGG